ncbi:MAG: energy transducer TonB [Sulfurisoma sp.]|nr:energy transducer TonB [Sulfurisoma sp.]
MVLAIVPAERLADLARPIAVRLIELAPDNPPPPPKQPPKKASPAPLPVLVTNSPEPPAQPTTFTVPPQPPAPPAPVPIAVTVAAPPAVPVTAARFDADYLDNPKPVYPHASRRLGEQGKVLLRVHVSATGLAEKVEVKLGSGFTRLDQAAQDAVSRWRFVPARRGDEAVAAWVQVPITFQLDS